MSSAPEIGRMSPRARSRIDPTHDAASVFRRIGILTLMVAFPVTSILLRVGPVVTYTIAIAMLMAASALEFSPRPTRETAARVLRSTAALAVLLALGWSVLSLAWTPVPAWRQDAAVVAVVLLAFAGLLALPERMRSANLYPIPVGAGFLAVLAIVLGGHVWTPAEIDPVRLERALNILVLLVWPGIAWLRSRRRDIEALALSFGTALAAALGPSSWPLLALAVGVLAHFLAQAHPRTAIVIGIVLAALVLLTPGLVALAALTPGLGERWVAVAARWHGALLGDPARLLTGHGTGSLLLRPDLTAASGALPLRLWYELGIVGAAAVAVAIATTFRRLPVVLGQLSPGAVGAATTAFVLGLGGVGAGNIWWPVTLATTALLFAAVRRGQFRTRRPRALSDLVLRSGSRQPGHG